MSDCRASHRVIDSYLFSCTLGMEESESTDGDMQTVLACIRAGDVFTVLSQPPALPLCPQHDLVTLFRAARVCAISRAWRLLDLGVIRAAWCVEGGGRVVACGLWALTV